MLGAWSAALLLLTRPVWIVAGMPISLGDLSGFATGVLCVWLAARVSIWNFPVGIVNSLILGVVFVEQRLFADASLQVVFIALSVRGLAQWRNLPQKALGARVFRSSRRSLWLLSLCVGLMTLLIWWVLSWAKGSAPLLDAMITALSLGAQWLLNRRMLETWALWIAVDLISIPLYFSRGLPLIAALYLVFLALCWQGFVSWRKRAVPSTAELPA